MGYNPWDRKELENDLSELACTHTYVLIPALGGHGCLS